MISINRVSEKASVVVLAALLVMGVTIHSIAGTTHRVVSGGSIQAVIDLAVAGDTVEVEPGTYQECLAVNKQNLTLKALGDVIVRYDGFTGEGTIVVISASGVTFDGFEITTASTRKIVGIAVSAVDVVIKNTRIHDLVGAWIRPNGAHRLLIENSTLYNSDAFGIYPLAKSDNVTVKGCYLVGSNGIRIHLDGVGWLVDSNYICGRHSRYGDIKFPFQTGDLGVVLEKGSGHTVVNNVIVGVTQAGIKVEANDCTVVNNTIAFCYDWASTPSVPMKLQSNVTGNGFGIRIKDVSGAVVCNNNLAYNYRGIGVYRSSSGVPAVGPAASCNIAFNNVFGSHTAGFAALGYTKGVEWINEFEESAVEGFDWDPLLTAINSDWQTGVSGNIGVDPKFASLNPFDYALLPGSGCIDAASNVRAPVVDIDGTVRPQDGNNTGAMIADIGAFEYIYVTPSAVYVDDDYTALDSNGHIWGYNAFNTIQAAVNGVAAGGTVNVAAGTYTEQVTISKTVVINGANAGISAGAVPGVRETESVVNGGFYVTGQGAVVDGFTIIGGYRINTYFGVLCATQDVVVRNNIITEVLSSQASGIEAQGGSHNLVVENNEICDNWRGIYLNSANGIAIRGNAIHDNNGVGVGIGCGDQVGISVTENRIYNHNLEGWGMSTLGPGAVAQRNVFFNNSLSVAHYSGAELDATRNYWGSEEPDFDTVMSGAVASIPWYADEPRTILRYPAGEVNIGGELIVGRGEEVVITDALNAGQDDNPATIRVLGGTLRVGQLNLTGDSVVEVIDGTLVLGTGDGEHSISGTFTIYNSFGSIYITENTEFSGATLALISDLHVANGVTLNVSGSLIWDGCTVDCSDAGGTFSVAVAEEGSFTLIRTELSDALITLAGSGAVVRDNILNNVDIIVTGIDNQVFHNIMDVNRLTDNGSGTVTTVDEWGNVGSVEAVKNALALSLSSAGMESGTLEDSNFFIRSGDPVRIELGVGALDKPIASTVAMLGFNTTFFNAASGIIAPVDPWEHGMLNEFTSAGVYGKINTAVGLKVGHGSAAGTTDSGTVAAITLQSKADAEEGLTRIYFRLKQEDDHKLATTRLSGFDGIDDYTLTPFTLNSGYVFVDNTAPEIADFAAVQQQSNADVDIFAAGAVVQQGVASFTVMAQDGFAGVAEDGANLTIVLRDSEPEVTLTAVFKGSEVVSAEEEEPSEFVGWTCYTFEVEINSTTPNGIYDAVMVVKDRAGNASAELSGSFAVNKNQLQVNIELQGGVADAFVRIVTLVATDSSNSVVAEWIRSVTFVNGVGSVELPGIPVGITGVSAKTPQTLRRKVGVALDQDGQGVVAFTGAAQLLGGDLNGDNVVDDLDFNRLRYYWYTVNTQADIDGNGASDGDDLNILRTNFYAEGDAL